MRLFIAAFALVAAAHCAAPARAGGRSDPSPVPPPEEAPVDQSELAREEEEAHFVPRWAIIGGASLSTGLRNRGEGWGPGARLGARRWLTPTLLAGGYLDYSLLSFLSDLGPGNAHVIAPTVRLEIGGRPYANTPIPEGAFYMLFAPVVVLDINQAPGTGYGWRAGAGGSFMATPAGAFVELYFQEAFLTHTRSRTAILVFGFGV